MPDLAGSVVSMVYVPVQCDHSVCRISRHRRHMQSRCGISSHMYRIRMIKARASES